MIRKVFYILLLVQCNPGAARAQAPAASFNVKDFGAKGDGRTDDSRAIQLALVKAQARVWSEQLPGSAYFYSAPVVFFPSGKYVLRESLKVTVNMAGEGGAILYQADKDKDILTGGNVWRWSIAGLTFVGGRHQLDIGNANIDTGKILIEKCSFYEAAGLAINLRKGSNSTQVTIRDCVFFSCRQALINHCDLATLRDSWISTSAAMKNQAAIENHGMLVAENIVGVPAVVRGQDQRWFDNHGGLTCRNFRFGGEGAGFTPVVNFAPYSYKYPVIPSHVILDSCYVYGLGNPKRPCAIFCEQVPNQIVVRSCGGFPDLAVLKVNPKLNLNAYFKNAEQRRPCLKFLIAGDNVEVIGPNSEVPEQMRPYLVGEIQGEAAPKTGHWHRPTFIRNRNLEGRWTSKGYVKSTKGAAQEPLGWMCIESGQPGKWREVHWNFK